MVRGGGGKRERAGGKVDEGESGTGESFASCPVSDTSTKTHAWPTFGGGASARGSATAAFSQYERERSSVNTCAAGDGAGML